MLQQGDHACPQAVSKGSIVVPAPLSLVDDRQLLSEHFLVSAGWNSVLVGVRD